MKKKDLYFYIKVFVLILFLAGSTFIMLFQFDNRNLKISFADAQGEEIAFGLNNYDIAHEDSFSFEFPFKELQLKEVEVYSRDLIMVKSWTYGQFRNFIADDENSSIKYLDDSLLIQSTGEKLKIMGNQEFAESIKGLSESMLQERLLLEEAWIIILAVVLMIGKLIAEKKEERKYKQGVVEEGKRFFKDIANYAYYIVYSAKTNLKAEVANSYLNRLWWLLEPFFNMVVYVIVFGSVLGNRIEHYELFIFSAILVWGFFNKSVSYSVKLVRANRDIVTKVYIPKFVILLSNMALNYYKMLFSMIVLVIMMVIFRVHISLCILFFIPVYLILILLTFGCGMILLHFGVFVDDLSHAITILLNMLMYLSGIFYNMSTTLSSPFNEIMMYCNPVAILIDSMRNALLYNKITNVPQLIIWFLLSVILCCVGVHTVYKNENGYVKVV